jgi:hypothetical protein
VDLCPQTHLFNDTTLISHLLFDNKSKIKATKESEMKCLRREIQQMTCKHNISKLLVDEPQITTLIIIYAVFCLA